MSLQRLASKYIRSAELVFRQMEVAETPMALDLSQITNVVCSAKAYLKDAEYYMEKKKFDVSLTSIGYCEGLLDALRLLGAVEFEWPTRNKKAKRNRK